MSAIAYVYPVAAIAGDIVRASAIAYIQPMTQAMPLRFRVKEWRETKGWTQQELADRAELRRATVSDIEGHRTQAISLDTLDKLARALDVEPGYLIIRVNEPKKRRGR